MTRLRKQILGHEFKAKNSYNLDWSQRYWFKRIFDQPAVRKHLGLECSTKITPQFCDEIAFFINSQCLKSHPIQSKTIERIFKNQKFLRSFSFSHPFQKYSFYTQAIPDSWFTFMNYGFHNKSYQKKPLRLIGAEKNWKYAAQFYHHIASQTNIRGKDVVEVGSGRGGGAAFLTRYFQPKSYIGIDGTQTNIMFCLQNHKVKGLKFRAGPAEKLPLQSKSADVVINVESINYYDPLSSFLDELHRVLRSGGIFITAFYGQIKTVKAIRKAIINSGFELIIENDVSKEVRKSIRLFKREDSKFIVRSNKLIREEALYKDFLNAVYDVDITNYLCCTFKKIEKVKTSR